MTIIVHSQYAKPRKPAARPVAAPTKTRAERDVEERKLAEMLYPTAVAKAAAEAGK